MERIRWEGQNFFEVVAPQEEEEEDGGDSVYAVSTLQKSWDIVIMIRIYIISSAR
jgi:hypothetical protein